MAALIEPISLRVEPAYRFMENVEFSWREESGKKILAFPVSSELPVEEPWGRTTLLHEPGAVRMGRANSGAMPFLFMHDRSHPIGMIAKMWLESRRAWVGASLFGSKKGQEAREMIDAGMRNVSIYYAMYKAKRSPEDPDLILATDWEPMETSLVTVPGDPTVGIGRAAPAPYEIRLQSESASSAEQGGNMSKETEAAAAAVAEKGKEQVTAGAEATRSAGGNGTGAVLEMERSRLKAIEHLAKANHISPGIAQRWGTDGSTFEQIGDDILKILEERGKSNPQPASRIGLRPGETQRFSLMRAIKACVERDWSSAGFEAECSRAVQQKLGRTPDANRFFVPYEVLQRPVEAKRDLTVATAGAGGYLVETENVGFIEMLRNRSVAFRMGARRLSGLVGSVTVPRQSAAATAVWLANEASTITESQQTFVQMALAPKSVGAYTELSRQLMLQSSPGAEGIVTDDLAQVVAIAADLAVIAGSGASGQPQGIIGTSGVGSVTGTSFDYADILEFQTDVAGSNVTPIAGGYITTPTVAALAMQRVKFASTASPLWEGNIWDGSMAGFKAMSSNQVPAGDMIFGDWQEVVVGEWGVLEIETNPFANFQAGIIGVRAIYSLDVGVRRPFAFSVMTSAT